MEIATPKISWIKQYFKNGSIFSFPDNIHPEKLAPIVLEKKYKKNKIAFHQGDPGSVLLILVSSLVKVSMIDFDDK